MTSVSEPDEDQGTDSDFEDASATWMLGTLWAYPIQTMMKLPESSSKKGRK